MEIKQIKLTLIQPSPRNPRKTFDEDAINELADNIRQQGLLQPITVRPVDWYDEVDEDGEIVSTPTKYEVVCGERRFRAFSLIACDSKGKLTTIPAIVRNLNDDEAFDAMITENLQRKDVDPIEEAFAFRELVKAGQDCKSIALRFGKSERYIQDRMKLASLSDAAVKAVRADLITLSGALMLAKLNYSQQNEIVKKLPETGATTAAMKTAIQRLMCSLDNAPFKLDEEYAGCPNKCSECNCNTSNHGCLFYEMKNDDAKCTNRECFEKKVIAYASSFLEKHKKDIARVNDGLFCGKPLVVVDTDACDDATRKVKQGIFNEAQTNGFKVVEKYGKELNGQSYYQLDDERVKTGVEEHTMVLGWTLYGYYLTGFTRKLNAYKVKNAISPNNDKLSEQEQEHRRVEEKYNEIDREYEAALTDAVLENGKAFDFEDNNPISDVELAAIYRLLIYESSSTEKIVGAILNEEFENYWDARYRVQDIPDDVLLANRNLIMRGLMIHKATDRYSINSDKRRKTLVEQFYRAADPDGCFKLDELHEEYDPQLEDLRAQLAAIEDEK